MRNYQRYVMRPRVRVVLELTGSKVRKAVIRASLREEPIENSSFPPQLTLNFPLPSCCFPYKIPSSLSGGFSDSRSAPLNTARQTDPVECRAQIFRFSAHSVLRFLSYPAVQILSHCFILLAHRFGGRTRTEEILGLTPLKKRTYGSVFIRCTPPGSAIT
jgi:hypothetical protein